MTAVGAFTKVKVIKIRSEGVGTLKVWRSHQRANRRDIFSIKMVQYPLEAVSCCS